MQFGLRRQARRHLPLRHPRPPQLPVRRRLRPRRSPDFSPVRRLPRPSVCLAYLRLLLYQPLFFSFSLVVFQGHGSFEFTACEPTIYFVVRCLLPPIGLRGGKVFSIQCSVNQSSLLNTEY